MPIDRQKLPVHAPPAQTTIDAANRAMAEDLRAATLGGAGDRRRCAAGFGSRIARGVQRSAPAPIIGSQDCCEFLRIEKSSVETMFACNAQPLLQLRQFHGVSREVERSTLLEADVAQLLAQLQPQLQAAHHQRKFDG